MNAMNLTDEQCNLLKITDERVDFYFKVENCVIDDTTLFCSIYESHLFMIMARFCNNHQVAFPSYARLAQLCYCSRSTIIKCMTSLEKKGYINKVTRKRTDNILINNTNLYTINNIKEYTMKDRKNDILDEGGGVPDTLGVVREIHQGSAPGTPYKEQTIKNNFKKNNTTTIEISLTPALDEKIVQTTKDSSSLIFEFLDLEEFKKINPITKKNIRKNIKTLDVELFRKIYKKAELEIAIGTGKVFDAILYNGLKNDWIFTCSDQIDESNNPKTPPVIDEAKNDWLRCFIGIKKDPEIFKYVKDKMLAISLDVLMLNKIKMGRMNNSEFKKHISSLYIQAYS